MRLRSYVFAGGLLVLVLIIAGVTSSVVRVRPLALSVDVHGYQRQGHELSALLVLTNTGVASLAVPLRFQCQAERVSGSTNYLVETGHTVFLQPGQHVVLSNKLWLVRLPQDTRAWRVNVEIRQMSGRERLVGALHRSGFVDHRMLSKLGGRPRKEADYKWVECGSGLLEVPLHSSRASVLSEE
jgi:hypothetical protein